MKYLPLIWAGLWRKRMRTLLTQLGVAAAFAVFGLLQIVDDGFRQLLAASHEDRLLVMGVFGKPLAIAAETQIQQIPGVVQTASVSGIFGTYQNPGNNRVINFVNDSYFDVVTELDVSRAQRDELYRTPTGIIVTRGFAEMDNLKVGDTYTLTSPIARKDGTKVWSFQVLSIVDNNVFGEAGRQAIGNASFYLEARADMPTGVIVFVTIADPDNAVQIGRDIDKFFQNSDSPTRTVSERAAFESGLQSLGDIRFFITAVSLGVMFMLLFLTGNTLSQAVRERRSEFAVMITLGFSPRGVQGLAVIESLVLCVFGAAVGLVCAAAMSPILANVNVALAPDLSARLVVLSIATAVIVGVVSSILPLQSLRKMSVVDVLMGH